MRWINFQVANVQPTTEFEFSMRKYLMMEHWLMEQMFSFRESFKMINVW